MDTRDVIQQLGGPSAVGRAINVRPQAVSLWCAANRIPVARVPSLVRLARELGVPLAPAAMRPDVDWSALSAA